MKVVQDVKAAEVAAGAPEEEQLADGLVDFLLIHVDADLVRTLLPCLDPTARGQTDCTASVLRFCNLHALCSAVQIAAQRKRGPS